MQIPEAHRAELKKMTPEAFIEALFVSGDYRQLEPKDVGGVEAVGFEVSDLTERFWGGLGGSQKMADIFFPVRALNARMWVDRTTRLPILVEAEGEIRPCLLTGYRKMRGTEINDRWEFDVPLDEAQFKPQIPEDYEALGLPGSVKTGAVVSGISLAGAPLLFMAAGRARRRCG